MATVVTDYVVRAEGGDRAASAQNRNQAWERWEDFEQAQCPHEQNIEHSLAWLRQRLHPCFDTNIAEPAA